MNNDRRQFLITHGLITVMLGVVSGIPLAFVITGDISGSMKAWHQAHLQGVMSGLLTLAAATFIGFLNFGEKMKRFVSWAFVVQAYGFSIGTIIGALTGFRGLEPAMPLGNMLLYIVYTIAILASIGAVGLSIYGAMRSNKTG
jgi:hypothetical protein